VLNNQSADGHPVELCGKISSLSWSLTVIGLAVWKEVAWQLGGFYDFHTHSLWMKSRGTPYAL
jgi:hypothetical protein